MVSEQLKVMNSLKVRKFSEDELEEVNSEVKKIRSQFNEKSYKNLLEDLKYAESVFKDYYAAPEALKCATLFLKSSGGSEIKVKQITATDYQNFLNDDTLAHSIYKQQKNIQNYVNEAKLKEFEDVFGMSFDDYSKKLAEATLFKKDRFGNSEFSALEAPELRISQLVVNSNGDNKREVESRIQKIAHSKIAMMNPTSSDEAWDKINQLSEKIERNPAKFLEKDVKIDPNVHDIELILTNRQAFSNAINAVKDCYSKLSLTGPIFTERTFSEVVNDPHRVRTIIDYFDKNEGELSKFEQLQNKVEDLESRKVLATEGKFQAPSSAKVTSMIDAIRNKSLNQQESEINKPKYA
jgi:hypothetical protein